MDRPDRLPKTPTASRWCRLREIFDGENVPMKSNFLKFFLAWVFLQVLMNLKWPSHGALWPDGLRLSPEIVAFMALLWLLGLRRNPLPGWLLAVLTTSVIFLRLFRLGEAITITYLNRQLNLYADPFLLPDLLNLLQRSLYPAHALVYAACGILVVAVLWFAVNRSFRASYRFLASAGGRWIFGGILATVLIAHLWLQPNGGPGVFGPMVIDRVAAEIDTLFDIPNARSRIRQEVAKADRTCPYPLAALEERDVYLIFIESYGHAAYAKPELFTRLQKDLKNFETALKSSGFSIASGFFSAPTYGGASWLSHATVASGVHINNQLRYNLLLESDARTLAGYFHRAGYRTIHVMPGTIWPWPEGDFFGFREKYYYRHFDYRGPAFGWSPMPDQFVFDTLYREVISAAQRPLFIEFVLTSVHAPFHRLPPYLTDWNRIGDGSIYAQTEMRRYPITWPDLSNATIAYTDALKYDFKSLEGFLLDRARDEALILVLGDHQPARQITGRNQPWSVPVHAISRNPRLLQPFLSDGFTAGIIPSQQSPHKGMESLRDLLLHQFCSPDIGIKS